MLELLVSAVIVGIVITIVSIAIGYYNEKKKRHIQVGICKKGFVPSNKTEFITNRKAVKPFRGTVKKDTPRTDYPTPHNSSIQGTDAFLYMILRENDIFNSTKPSEDERGHSDFGNGGSFGGGGASGSFDTDSSSSYDSDSSSSSD